MPRGLHQSWPADTIYVYYFLKIVRPRSPSSRPSSYAPGISVMPAWCRLVPPCCLLGASLHPLQWPKSRFWTHLNLRISLDHTSATFGHYATNFRNIWTRFNQHGSSFGQLQTIARVGCGETLKIIASFACFPYVFELSPFVPSRVHLARTRANSGPI